MFPEATATTEVAGTNGVAVKTTGVRVLKDACTAGEPSVPLSVQVTWVWPLEPVFAGVEIVPPAEPDVNTELLTVPGVNTTVWPLTGLLKVSCNNTTSGEAKAVLTAPDCPLPETMLSCVAVPATDVSVKDAVAVAPVVSTEAVTVLT